MKLAGRTAIVTGAASGIGKAIALRLAQDGASVVVADLRGHDVAAAEIAAATGRKALGLPVDISNEADVARVTSETVKAFNGIDILVNNAALFSPLEPKPFDRIEPDEWRRVMEVNTLGVFLCCRACAPYLRKSGRGRIVNLASGAPIKGVPFLLHYVSSKGAVIAMTRALARELGKDGVTVNALAPGFTLSESIQASPAHLKHGAGIPATRAIARDETPQDLVGAVSFLASDDAAFMTGQTLVVDGGSAMV
jgi:NAD(P)-dependent dehydrogenase (short-subunit alcohol dehydrogenase family)